MNAQSTVQWRLHSKTYYHCINKKQVAHGKFYSAQNRIIQSVRSKQLSAQSKLTDYSIRELKSVSTVTSFITARIIARQITSLSPGVQHHQSHHMTKLKSKVFIMLLQPIAW